MSYKYDYATPLREDVCRLPLCVFKRLLKSEALQLQSENDAFPLLRTWLRYAWHTKSFGTVRRLFDELAPLLRYHHMTPDFLANVVLVCYYMKESRVREAVITSALSQRNAAPLTAIEQARGAKLGSGDRGVPLSAACWELKASFGLREIALMELNESRRCWCGIVAGYVAFIAVTRGHTDEHDKEEDIEDTLGVFLAIQFEDDGEGPGAGLAGGPSPGVGLQFTMTISPDISDVYGPYFCMKTLPACGSTDSLDKPWAEAVYEGSPHFPDGKLEVKVIVKLAPKE